MADRTPVVLALLVDALQTRPDDHDIHALADGVALAVDHGAAAGLWPPTDIDTSDAEVIKDMSLDDVTFGAANDRPMLVAVARRLADVAASLRVRGEHMRREAEALWRAASRLLGLDVTDTAIGGVAGHCLALRQVLALPDSCGDDHATLCGRVAMIVRWRDEVGHPAVAEVGRLRRDLASMTEQRDEALRQLADLRREMAGVFRR